MALTALISGCATSSETADSQRRRDMVLVPQDAQPVERLQWRDVRTIQPLNRRMVLMKAGRPYLLVLAHPCQALRSDSIVIVENRGTFTPRMDTLRVTDPVSDYGTGLGLERPGVSLSRNDLIAGSSVCRPDTLYAIRDEDIDWLRESLARK